MARYSNFESQIVYKSEFLFSDLLRENGHFMLSECICNALLSALLLLFICSKQLMRFLRVVYKGQTKNRVPITTNLSKYISVYPNFKICTLDISILSDRVTSK